VAAALALDEGLAFPDPQNGNEEEGKVVVDPGEVRSAQAAVGAEARLLIETFLSRSDPADTDKDHDRPLPLAANDDTPLLSASDQLSSRRKA
jgi:hypothetical protein